MHARTRRIELEGAFGDRLAARLELPTGEPTAVALFAHCFTCSKDFKAVVRISKALAEKGLGVCRFDFTGLGESDGNFSDTNFSSNLGDLRAAASFLLSEFGGPQLLIGHSLGGTAALAVANSVETVRAVATIAAPSDTTHFGQTLLRKAPDLAARGEARVVLGGREFLLRRQLVEDLAAHRMQDSIARLRIPLLILHSPRDEVVGIEHAERIYQLAPYPKSLVSLDGADHLLRRGEDSRFVAELLAVWATRALT